MDAESAYDKENRDPNPAHVQRQQGEKRRGEMEVAKQTLPRQHAVTVRGGKGMKEEDAQDGEAAQVINKFDAPGGIFHIVACHGTRRDAGSKAGSRAFKIYR